MRSIANFQLHQMLRHEDNGCGAPPPIPLFPTVVRSAIACAVVLVLVIAGVRWVVS